MAKVRRTKASPTQGLAPALAAALRPPAPPAGAGPNPPLGYQIVVDYVAMTPDLRVFDNSLEKGKPYDIRVTSGTEDGPAVVIKGLNEGLLSMKPGGLRRLYIPGELAFPKGLASAPGRPRVPPATPVVFDVALRFIPGLEELSE